MPMIWHLVPTLLATCLWAFSDVCCDACIVQADGGEPSKLDRRRGLRGKQDRGNAAAAVEMDVEAASTESTTPTTTNPFEEPTVQCTTEQRLTVWQYMLISVLVNGAAALIACVTSGVLRPGRAVLGTQADVTTVVLSLAAGVVHFCSYYLTTKAFETASSTVITPLLQMSAIWMLPISMFNSYFQIVESDMIEPVHLGSFALIVLGGLLPAARGNVARFFEAEFWKIPAVSLCLIGELGVCIYNLLLHRCTYRRSGSVLQFFVLSRLGNVAAASILICSGGQNGVISRLGTATTPTSPVPTEMSTTSSPGWSSSNVPSNWRYWAIAALGQSLSVLGVFVIMVTYSVFYEPAVVNALEGGMQQLLNLLFATLLYRLCSFGRPVGHVRVKLVSVLLITTGIYLSTIPQD